MRLLRQSAIVLGVLALAGVAQAKGSLTWYGHAAFKIETPSGKVILVDPWITNPSNKNGKEDLAKITKADLILISHGHFDHVGDGPAIAKKTGAKLVATFDLGNQLVRFAGFPKESYGFETGGNFGGELTLLDGEVTIAFVPAVHSSAVSAPGSEESHFGGAPGGFVIAIKNGPTIYHTGDTDLFGDMKEVSHGKKITHMLACIGDHFTMGPARAAEAVRLVNPTTVIPMHFATFPVLSGTPADFGAALKKTAPRARLQTLEIGKPVEL